MKLKKIMILGAGILQLPAIEKAKEMGLQVIAIDMNPDAIGFKADGIVKEVISTIDIPKIVDAAKRHKIDGVMTLATDMPMQAVAAVAKELKLTGITNDTAFMATNKAAMRKALRAAGVPCPLFYIVAGKEDYLDAVQKIMDAGYGCIVKPVDNSGSRGIYLLNDFKEGTVNKAYEYSKRFSRSGDLMVEEYMDGDEVSVETLCINGNCYVLQITDKITTGAPYFVEIGHSQPSHHPSEIQRKIAEVAILANRAIGIENGPSHTEIKVTKDGPKIVELGARMGGDNIATHLVPLSTGIDMVECCIRIALGEIPDIRVKYSKGSAVRYINSKAGVIEKVDGVEEAKCIFGVKQISIVHRIGDTAREIKSSVDRIGFVIAQADNAGQAVSACEQALEKINVTVGRKQKRK